MKKQNKMQTKKNLINIYKKQKNIIYFYNLPLWDALSNWATEIYYYNIYEIIFCYLFKYSNGEYGLLSD